MSAWHEWQYFPVLVGICLLLVMILAVANVLTRDDSIAEVNSGASQKITEEEFLVLADGASDVLTIDQEWDDLRLSHGPVRFVSEGYVIARMHDRDDDGSYETLELLHEGEVVRVFVYNPEKGWEENKETP